jgi:NAD(P)-dependent dehydrogenase (short-subunit alcohol dehydrogenase family)
VLLENKNAVIYGAGGSVGGAVARAFAREGARVFLAGRTAATLDAVAADIAAGGGAAETAEVDALDERAVDDHVDDIAARAGGIDVSFNSIGHGDVHGLPLLDMPFEDFWRPIAAAVRSQFLTTRAAARHMVPRASGVILAIAASTARQAIPNVGGTGVTFDAIESQCRQWASELGRRGVRVAWLQTSGISDAISRTVERFPDYGLGSMTRDELISWLQGKSMLGRLTTLADVGAVAAFVASDRAAAITGTGVDLTCGSIGGR